MPPRDVESRDARHSTEQRARVVEQATWRSANQGASATGRQLGQIGTLPPHAVFQSGGRGFRTQSGRPKHFSHRGEARGRLSCLSRGGWIASSLLLPRNSPYGNKTRDSRGNSP